MNRKVRQRNAARLIVRVRASLPQVQPKVAQAVAANQPSTTYVCGVGRIRSKLMEIWPYACVATTSDTKYNLWQKNDEKWHNFMMITPPGIVRSIESDAYSLGSLYDSVAHALILDDFAGPNGLFQDSSWGKIVCRVWYVKLYVVNTKRFFPDTEFDFDPNSDLQWQREGLIFFH